MVLTDKYVYNVEIWGYNPIPTLNAHISTPKPPWKPHLTPFLYAAFPFFLRDPGENPIYFPTFPDT